MLPCRRVPFDPSLRRCHIRFHNSLDELLQNRRRKLFRCSKLPLLHSGTLFERGLFHAVTFQVEMYIFVAIQAMACQDQGLSILKIKTSCNNRDFGILRQPYGNNKQIFLTCIGKLSSVNVTVDEARQ